MEALTVSETAAQGEKSVTYNAGHQLPWLAKQVYCLYQPGMLMVVLVVVFNSSLTY